MEQTSVEKQKLYLLEFIVDDINLDFCNMQQLLCQPPGETVLQFKFLDMGPFRITESDFSPRKKNYLDGCTGTGNIKVGKSCLFGLTPTKVQEVKGKMIIICDVLKEMIILDSNQKPETVSYQFGTSLIPIMNMFQELVDSVHVGGEKIYSKHIKDCFKIKNLKTGDLIGHLVAYIRVSCFNEMIINKFRREKSLEVDYKNEKGYYNYKFNKIVEDKTLEKQDLCSCDISGNKNDICSCPSQHPAENCPQPFTSNNPSNAEDTEDQKCPLGCPSPRTYSCEPCPEICLHQKNARDGYFGEDARMKGKGDKNDSRQKGKKGKGGDGNRGNSGNGFFRRSKEEEAKDQKRLEEGMLLLMQKLKRNKERLKNNASCGGGIGGIGGSGGIGSRQDSRRAGEDNNNNNNNNNNAENECNGKYFGSKTTCPCMAPSMAPRPSSSPAERCINTCSMWRN